MPELFLDANAHLPMNPKAVKAFVDFNQSLAGHGHAMASSAPGRKAAGAIEEARKKIAQLIGAEKPDQIVFTSSCTQACEWGLNLLKQQGFNKVYRSQIEHKAVSEKAKELFPNSEELYPSKNGLVACGFNPEPSAAFVCMHVQNEIGTIQKIDTIKVPFFCDMSQSLGKTKVNVSSMPNLKVAVFGAHKFGGPVGVGFMYVKDTSWWKAFGSGSRYYMDRPGTPDAGMIVATAIALEEAIKSFPERYGNAVLFQDIIEAKIESKGLSIIGKDRIPFTTFFKVGGNRGPYLMAQMETEGMYIGLGSACGSVTATSSALMTAMGHGGSAQDYVRISTWGEYGVNEAKTVARAIAKYC